MEICKRLYQTQVANINNFKNRIQATVAMVDVEMLQHTWMELEYCLDIVCVTNGAHAECVCNVQNKL
jgi:hypothetical protein